MLIAAITVGDSFVTLNAVQSLEPADRVEADRGISYTLSFHDLPSGTKEDVSYVTEIAALYALASWIYADETKEMLELHHTQALATLQTTLKSNKFLP